jgi:hypothetical protein
MRAVLSRVSWIFKYLVRGQLRVLRADRAPLRELERRLFYGGCVGLPDWSIAFIDAKLAPQPGDLVYLRPVDPAHPAMVKFFDVDADGRWLLRTVDVVLRYDPRLHVLAGTVVAMYLAPPDLPAPSPAHAAMAREAEADRAELRRACQEILQERAWGIAHDFTGVYEPVRTA